MSRANPEEHRPELSGLPKPHAEHGEWSPTLGPAWDPYQTETGGGGPRF